MVNPIEFIEECKALGISLFTGVPDSLMKSFCTEIENQENHVVAANEGTAVATAIGYHLSTGSIPLVYMQNSGLGNAINPLLSIASKSVYRIPMILMIGWRGEKEDEPQHVEQGKRMKDLIDALGFSHFTLQSMDDLKAAYNYSKQKSEPIFLIVSKNVFEESKEQRFSNQRYEILQRIYQDVKKRNGIIVSTTGHTSRELYEICEGNTSNIFMNVGGMGHASSIALGIAKGTDRQVFCVDGDGSALMHLGSFAQIGYSKQHNLNHIVINNQAHDSVGGQSTCSINISEVAKACGYAVFDKLCISEMIDKGPSFCELKIDRGTRSSLGRPSRDLVEYKNTLMRELND